MEQQNTPLKTIQSKDINSCVNDIPELRMHIRDDIPQIQGDIEDDSDYVRINKKPELNESYDLDRSKETQNIAAHAVTGNDYNSDLESLHRNIKPFVPEGKESNPFDNYIYDVLKKGKPSGETVAHIHDIMYKNYYGVNDETHGFGSMDMFHNQKYLSDKWEPLLYAHVRKDRAVTDPMKADFTKEEINKIPNGFIPIGLKMLRHKASGHIYEMHPTEGLTYITNKFHIPPKFQRDVQFENTTDLAHALHEHYKYDKSPAVTQYTEDSAPVNRYLHLTHTGKLGDMRSVVGMHVDDIEPLSQDISNHFKEAESPAHLPDFHVYTGLYRESNPNTGATHRDEHGNLIFHNPSFTSTSLDNTVAESFAKTKGDPDYELRDGVADVFKIKIPGGYPHGAFIRPISNHSDENEYLLDKGHTFKVKPNPIRHYVSDGKMVRLWEAELHPKDIDHFAKFEDMEKNDKLDALMHPDVTSETIEKAAKDENISVRSMAARHPRLHPDTMKALAKDDSPRVRQASMLNQNLPHEVMRETVKDPINAVSLARRKELPEDILHSLVNHDFESVNAEAAKRNDLSSDHIGQLIKTGGDSVMKSLAGNSSLHPDLLHEFRDHKNNDVRLTLAKNPSIHAKTAIYLKEDPHIPVFLAASKNPAISKE